MLIISTLLACTGNKKKDKKESLTAEDGKISLVLKSETIGLIAPESVVYNAPNNMLYISCQGGTEVGDGYVAILNLDGEVIDSTFIVGLNNPKGIQIVGNKLYVSDVLELIEANLQTGEIENKYTDAKIQFLNDVTIDEKGNIYVSDMFTSSIYKLDTAGNFGEWITSTDLENPNGLLAIGDDIIVGGWGNFSDGQPLNAPKGRLSKINIATQEISKITPEPLGQIDGIQTYDASSFIISDWKEGKIYQVKTSGEIIELLDTERGPGDILFLKNKNLLAIPLKIQNKVEFYTVN